MMRYTENEVMEFVRENEVKFIRLAFCDLFGAQKNISITAEELPRAFAGGISFDASAIEGFLNVDRSDLFLFPEPDTLAVLPWRRDGDGRRGSSARFAIPTAPLLRGTAAICSKGLRACAGDGLSLPDRSRVRVLPL